MSVYWEQHLAEIREQLLMMSGLTERNLGQAARALMERDGRLADLVESEDSEIDELEKLLLWSTQRIAPGASLAVLSFHSLEDRLVKELFRQGEVWKAMTKKPRIASDDEVTRNPRARSAKLRVARRLPLPEADE